MRIVYKGTKGNLDRCAIITYTEKEHDKVMEIVAAIESTTPYKCDTYVYGMVIIDVDDKDDYNNFKDLYKELKHINF